MRPDIELRLYWYFVTVAEELNFRRAAERVGIAQPPLSQQIRRLERRLGGDLFHREKRSVRLTEAGTALLPQARALLAAAAETGARIRRITAGEVGSLVIGFTPSALFSPLPAAVREYRERFPEVGVELRQYFPYDFDEVLRRGALDVAIVREPDRASGHSGAGDGIMTLPILRERFVAALPAAHRLAGRESLALAELAGEPFVLFPEEITPGLYWRVREICAEAGFQPRVVQIASEWQTILSLVEAGLGVSLVPESLALRVGESVSITALEGAEVWTEVAACARAEGRTPATENFMRILRGVARPGDRER
ncbi:MAG TPA: LysR family transcriptional regulator [Longimicrobium sp.]|jgi:DNA-binding transcriptional LysR family regulator